MCMSTFSKVFIRAASPLRMSCLEFPLSLLPILGCVSIYPISCKIEFIRAPFDVFSMRTIIDQHLSVQLLQKPAMR